MEIVLAKNIGFCNGVNKSIEETEKELTNNNDLYVLGELVHNDNVINGLKKKGLKIIDKLPEYPCNVIIRAHGVPEKVYSEAKSKEINLIDLTCPKVLAIHKLASKLKEENYFIILVGKKKHPEVIGTISYCGKNSIAIENEDEITNLKIEANKIAVISQTTYSLEKFEIICNKLQNKYNNIKIYNTICKTTKERQEEIKELSKNVDMILIIGDKKSSNTNKLYELASKLNPKTFLVENENDLDKLNFNGINKIGISSGASTSKDCIQKVINRLNSI